jgi:hypothetical protein
MRRSGGRSLLFGVILAVVVTQVASAGPLLRARDLPAACATGGSAAITITPAPNAPRVYAEQLKVDVRGLAGNTRLHLFMTQVPSDPYGISVYLGDVVTSSTGAASRVFWSRFNAATFLVAEGSTQAPKPHGSADAGTNPSFKPVHTYHVGLWFASDADARKNGASCTGRATPFNPTHNAGRQLFSSRNAANTNDLSGPLSTP